MKKIFAFVMAICFALSIASCGGNGTATGATEADSTEVVTDTVNTVVVDSTAVDSIVAE